MTRPAGSWPGGAIVRRRWAVLAALLAITVGLGAGLPALRFDFSPDSVFETGGEAERRWRALCRTFGKDDALVLLVVRHRAGVLRPGVLAYVHRLTRAVARERFVVRARGLTTVRVALGRGDELRVGALGPAIREAQVRGNPLFDGPLINAARTATFIAVELAPGHDEAPDRLRPVMKRLRALTAASAPPAGVTTQLYGLPDLRLEAVEIMRREQRVLLSAMVALFAVVLFALFGRRAVAVLAPLGAVGLTLVWVLGLMGHTGQPVGILTNVLPLLLFAIGISDAIHLLARYREEAGPDALPVATSRLAAACLVTSVTTAVGFASLATSRTSVLVQFGWIAAAGVLLAYVATILQVPALLSFARPLAPRSPGPAPTERLLRALARLVLARPVLALALTVGACSLLAVGAARVQMDVRIRGHLDPDAELARRYQALERDAGGLVSLVISVRSDHERGLRSARVLRRVWALQRFVEGQPGAGRSLSPASLVRALKVALVGTRPAGAAAAALSDPNLPDSDEQLAQLLLVSSLGEVDMPWERYVTGDWRQLRIVTRFTDRGSRAHAAVFARIERRAAELFADVPGVRVELSGQGQLAVVALHHFIEDLLLSLLTAACVIFGAIGLLLRSWRAGLISVIPNLLPLGCALGYMGLRGIPLSSVTVVAFPVALGLVVDDTIHFLARFREERQTHPVSEAVERTLLGTGRPIVATTLLLALGVGVLLCSSFLASRQMAEVLLVAILTALPADLLVLPALLRLVGRRR